MRDVVKLTSMAKAAGCAAKLAAGTLDAVLRRLPRQTDPNVLVGFETSDDAGVYQLDENTALVQTVDFYAHRRRSGNVRPNCGGKFAKRHLRHGRPADLRAVAGRIPGQSRSGNS